MSQSVEINGMDELDAAFQQILEKRPAMKREMHERVAKAVESEVDAQVDSSGINDSGGKIKEWQKGVVGSGGGYAAVKAVKGQTGNDSPGAITNYLENGHRIRPPGEKKRRSRAKNAYVDGYHFYQEAEAKAEEIAQAEAQKFVDEVAEKLEGGS